MYADFEQHDAAVIEQVRTEKPDVYLRILVDQFDEIVFVPDRGLKRNAGQHQPTEVRLSRIAVAARAIEVCGQ